MQHINNEDYGGSIIHTNVGSRNFTWW